MPRSTKWGLALWATLLPVIHPAQANWVERDLPALSAPFAPFAMAHLPDGRYVYGESGQLFLQDAFGGSTRTAFANEPLLDPSFIAIRSSTEAVAGGGGFGISDLFTFNPTSPNDPGFTGLGLSIQNYQGVYRDADGLYIGGTYSGFTHGVRFVSLDGSVSQVIISNVATFSAGIARDAGGNLYVGDTDNGEVRRFTPAQLGDAIDGAPLAMGDGELIHDFGGGGNIGSIAVDSLGRVWAAGYLHNGLRVYDPTLGLATNIVPGLTNANYTVMTFTRDGIGYVAYINQEDPFSGGTAMRYGYRPTAYALQTPAALDFDADRRADVAVYFPPQGRWYVNGSTQGPLMSDFGWSAALPFAAHYDGDARADLAVYHPASGTWYVRDSAAATTRTIPWGWSASVPVPADFDGDGRADIAVYHPGSGNWYIHGSASNGTDVVQNWGWSEAVPVPADYDGDGKADLAVYHPDAGNWHIQYSGGGSAILNWGFSGAEPVPADYDGDGLADLAVYQPEGGVWFIQYSSGGTRIQSFGWNAASPVPSDYDGDGKADLAVFHRPAGLWYLRRSSDDATITQQWGWSQVEPAAPQWQANKWLNARLHRWSVP